MIGAPQVAVEGVPALVADLRGLGRALDDLDVDALAAEHARAVATAAPRRTGRLASSFRPTRGAKNEAVVSSSVPYAGPINYGWPARNIASAHFIAEADRAVTPRAVRELESEINQQIRRKGLNR